MARVVLPPEAQGDSDAIITGWPGMRDSRWPTGYADRFDAAYDVLMDHPEIGPRRPRLGPDVRIKVVTPDVMVQHQRSEVLTADKRECAPPLMRRNATGMRQHFRRLVSVRDGASAAVTFLRIVHGGRRITRGLLL